MLLCKLNVVVLCCCVVVVGTAVSLSLSPGSCHSIPCDAVVN